MTLEQNIISAIKRCEKEFVFDNNSKFSIYPFTTENISGYIEQFDLYDIPIEYEPNEEMNLDYVGKSKDTKSRYDLLKSYLIFL